MRILAIAPALPEPLDGGAAIRTRHLLRALAHVGEVTLVAWSEGGATLPDVGEVVTCPNRRGRRHDPTELLRAWARGRPYALSKYDRPAMDGLLTNLIARKRYDLVLACQLHTAALAERHARTAGAKGTPWVLDAHNVESDIWSGLARTSRWPLRPVFAFEADRLGRVEAELGRRADAVLCCSAGDARWFAVRGARAHLVPNGVDIEHFGVPRVAPIPGRIAYVGALDWRPNEVAVRRFLRTTWPALRRSDGRLSFVVAGRRPSADLKALAERSEATLLADLPDIRPVLAEAEVVVVPLDVGSGSRLKLLTAFAMGRCVVATPAAAAGLDCQDGQELLIADDRSLVAAIRRLLDDAALRRRLGQNARLFAERLSWRRVGSMAIDVVRQVAGSGARLERRPRGAV